MRGNGGWGSPRRDGGLAGDGRLRWDGARGLRALGLHAKARSITGVEGWPFRAVADAMEVIPRTLVQNSGGNAMRVLTELRVSHVSLYLIGR